MGKCSKNLHLVHKCPFSGCNICMLLKHFSDFWKLNDLAIGCCTSKLFVKWRLFCCMKTSLICIIHHHKPSYMYLQTILGLPKTHPDVHQMFQNGFHTIHRSGNFGLDCPVLLWLKKLLWEKWKSLVDQGTWNGWAATFHLAVGNTSDCRSESSNARVHWYEVLNQPSA